MKHQALFSSKDKGKNIKVSSAAILLGALRVKRCCYWLLFIMLTVCCCVYFLHGH